MHWLATRVSVDVLVAYLGLGGTEGYDRLRFMLPAPEHRDSRTPRLCDAPNQYARPPSVEISDQATLVRGYQEFVLTRHSIMPLEPDEATRRKQELLQPYFTPRVLAQRTVLDIGANGGFFSFWASQNMAERVVAMEIDEAYVSILGEVLTATGLPGVEIATRNIADWSEPVDVVLALAIVHWIYSCTAVLGSIEGVVEKLASLTRYMAVIEWVDPDDPAIAFFGHTNWNSEFLCGPYELHEFEAALAKNFARFECIGEVTSTRRIYIAFKSRDTIDLTCPLPLAGPAEALISCKCLCRFNGTDYWSLVYDLGNHVLKQTSVDLATREATLLKQLDSPYFPKVLESGEGDGFTWLTSEKVGGGSVTEVNLSEPEALQKFALECIDILDLLSAKGIAHNDIRPQNLIVRDGMPVLIDFGWASSVEMPLLQVPDSLGEEFRPPEGALSDLYSMGRVLKMLAGDNAGRVAVVADLMTAGAPGMRVTDLNLIRTLLILSGA